MGDRNSPTADRGVSIDELFEALADAENRYVLAYVTESDGPVAIRELVAFVVERTECPSDLSEAEFEERVQARLEHSALPALDELGLVAYDGTEGTVGPTEGTAVAEPHLELALGEDAAE